MARPRRAPAPRRAGLGLSLIAGGVLALLNVAAFVPAFRGVAPSARGSSEPTRRAVTARQAEGEGGEGEDEGFLKFLKVEQDIELSQEEYALALEAEVEDLRKRLYINGEVKPGNLIVPWKGVDEEALLKEGRRKLRKNGIKDPSGADVAEDEKDSEISLSIVGDQDVVLNWAAGVPAQKVGYIVERKPSSESSYVEIASYEAQQNAYLLSKPYAGHEYEFADQLVPPGGYSYRVLVRMRTGEVEVVDSKEIAVPEPEGLENFVGFIGLGVIVAAFSVGGIIFDPSIK